MQRRNKLTQRVRAVRAGENPQASLHSVFTDTLGDTAVRCPSALRCWRMSPVSRPPRSPL